MNIPRSCNLAMTIKMHGINTGQFCIACCALVVLCKIQSRESVTPSKRSKMRGIDVGDAERGGDIAVSSGTITCKL